MQKRPTWKYVENYQHEKNYGRKAKYQQKEKYGKKVKCQQDKEYQQKEHDQWKK